ncbi:DUF6493 family protein [Streptomyces megasporus]|uniref:DUF6493 family protein n=1 Tax=Streptomyces megasporus TaxID=44060 RepID=UPI00099655C0|nr:DUF6493 family protein [Streptomyces megasporus]
MSGALARLVRMRARTDNLPAEERKLLDEAERTLDPDAYAVLLAVADGEHKRLPELIAGLSEKQRRSCVPHLKTWRTLMRETWNLEARPRKRALVIAGAGCHTGAAAAAQWLAHDDLVLVEPFDVHLLLTVLADRPAPWLGDVAHRLADRIRPDDTWRWAHYTLTERLVLLAGCPVPDGDGFVLAWVRERMFPERSLLWPGVVDGALTPPLPSAVGVRSGTLVERLRSDPFLDALAPRLFEVDGVGALLDGWGTVPDRDGSSWSGALTALAAEGRLDRAALLDGCLSRLLRGGRPTELRGFLALLKALDPTDDEYAARTTVLLRLLPDAPSTVASLAQERLAALDADGRLDVEHLVEASRTVLFRTEKKLVRAQLTWLDTAARRDRKRAGAVVLAAADAFGHEDAAVQERALNLMSRHLKHAGDAVRGELADAAASLSPALRPRAAELLGLEPLTDESAGPVEDVLPPVPEPAPMPPPLATAAEVAEEVNAVLAAAEAAERSGSVTAGGPDATAFERALDGLVRHAHRDRRGLVRALRPVVRAHPWHDHHDEWWGDAGAGELRFLVAVLCGEAPGDAPSAPGSEAVAHLRRQNLTPFGRVLAARLLEAAWWVVNDPPPFLLATPTTVDGRIAPAELIARLAEYERTGATPGPCDLDQALLRLDTAAVTPEVPEAAGRLGSPAGRRLRAWLEAGGLSLPEPVREVRTVRSTGYDPTVTRVVLSAPAPVVPCEPAPGFRRLLSACDAPDKRNTYAWHSGVRLWPTVLPNHRELVALCLQSTFAAAADDGLRGGAALLPVLAEAGGPAGAAVHLGLAHALGARHPEDRTAAVDALLLLAARGDLDPTRLGRDVAETVSVGTVKPNRLLESLRETARAGAPGVVWSVLAAALPALLAFDRPPRGLPDLLALGAECAGASGAREPVDGLAEVAARGGGGRLVKEARRLRDTLAG